VIKVNLKLDRKVINFEFKSNNINMYDEEEILLTNNGNADANFDFVYM